jgi:polysaccharide export outer membrane protein
MRVPNRFERSFARAALAATAVFLLAMPASAQDTSAQAPARYATMTPPTETVTVTGLRHPRDETGYRLGAGDKLRVTVFNEDDLSGEFQVDGGGYVRLPLIGQVKAAGLTTYDLEGNVEAALDKGAYLINPRVNIEVTTYRPYYILGQVNKPGEYPYVNAMSALNAVAVAGGYTDQAVESTLYIRHEGETEEHEVDLDETTKIFPGDVVRVPRTTFWSVASVLTPLLPLAYLIRP